MVEINKRQQMKVEEFLDTYVNDISCKSIYRSLYYCRNIIRVDIDESAKPILEIKVDEAMNVIRITCVSNNVETVQCLLHELACKSAPNVFNVNLTKIFDATITVYKGVYDDLPLKLYTVSDKMGMLVDVYGREVLLVNYIMKVRKERIDMNYAVKIALRECG